MEVPRRLDHVEQIRLERAPEVSHWLRPLTVTPAEADRPSKREVEPAREKRQPVPASLREDPLPHALVESPGKERVEQRR